jgi:hypothetical protein
MPDLPSLLFNFLATLASPVQPEPAYTDEPVCDDGSSPYDKNGRPNIRCEIDGCSVIDRMCWSERLNYCYDDNGSDNGFCGLYEMECHNGLSCSGMWLACVGQWACEDPHWWGCGEGSCTEATP